MNVIKLKPLNKEMIYRLTQVDRVRIETKLYISEMGVRRSLKIYNCWWRKFTEW